jgi:hypothetical protein
MAHQSQVREPFALRGKREILRTILTTSRLIGIGICSYALPARTQSGDGDPEHESGNPYAFGSGVPRDFTQTIVWLRKAAQQGDVNAQSSLGILLSPGMPGAPTDYVEAMRWLQEAADRNDSATQANLGGLYRSGTGVQKDYQTASTWFQKSANQGSPGENFTWDSRKKTSNPDVHSVIHRRSRGNARSRQTRPHYD